MIVHAITRPPRALRALTQRLRLPKFSDWSKDVDNINDELERILGPASSRSEENRSPVSTLKIEDNVNFVVPLIPNLMRATNQIFTSVGQGSLNLLLVTDDNSAPDIDIEEATIDCIPLTASTDQSIDYSRIVDSVTRHDYDGIIVSLSSSRARLLLDEKDRALFSLLASTRPVVLIASEGGFLLPQKVSAVIGFDDALRVRLAIEGISKDKESSKSRT